MAPVGAVAGPSRSCAMKGAASRVHARGRPPAQASTSVMCARGGSRSRRRFPDAGARRRDQGHLGVVTRKQTIDLGAFAFDALEVQDERGAPVTRVDDGGA
jgi:hypothetical protein